MSRAESLLGNLRQLLSTTFGVRGGRNAASWIVAGGIAYYAIYLPEQRKREAAEREALLAKERAVAAGVQAIDRARPLPDPQDRGIIKGAGTAAGSGSSGGS